MTARFCYKKEPSKLVKVFAWIIAGVSVALWVYAFCAIWFWAMLVTVLATQPQIFTYWYFAVRMSAFLVLTAPIAYLFSGALEQLLNAYFRERV
jgi:hypothetical protein